MFWDYIFLLRPTLFVPVWTFLLIGYARAGGAGKMPALLCAFILYTLLMGTIYIINQIADRESDKINKKLFLLSEGYISPKNAYIEILVLLIIVLLISIPYPPLFKLFLLFSFILGILYSVPPFKFKGRPIFDLLSNALGYGFLNFSIGWMTTRNFSAQTFLYSLPYIFAVGAVFVNTTIPDIEGDKKTGEITTGVFLGKNNALTLSTILIFSSFILSLILMDWICLIAAICASPLFILALIRKDLKYCFISIRVSAPILVLIIAFLYPWFLVPLLFVFLSQRIYYKKRFGIVYPKIT